MLLFYFLKVQFEVESVMWPITYVILMLCIFLYSSIAMFRVTDASVREYQF